MNFTCVLQVCKGDCEESNCMGYAGWGRKKRDVTPVNVIGEINASNKVPSKKESVGSIGHNIAKRQTEDFDIDVGARVKIVEKYSEIQIITEETMCMNGAVLITTIVFLSTGVICLAGSTFVFYRKFASAHAQALLGQRQSDLPVRNDSAPYYSIPFDKNI
ncbi:uncharacterized protein LOC127837972 [Dreissena polymorpha]|nr:uncharacterized protein LOC127837972 [Dreissena polymorpha]